MKEKQKMGQTSKKFLKYFWNENFEILLHKENLGRTNCETNPKQRQYLTEW